MLDSLSLPPSVKNVLWSYDLRQIDLNKHKKLIIAQVLNFGSTAATDWLFRTYKMDEIKDIAAQIPSGQWDKKSLNLWALYLGIHPAAKHDLVGL